MSLHEEFKTQPITLSEQDLEPFLSEWGSLPRAQHEKFFLNLSRRTAEELFLRLPARDQAELLGFVPGYERKSWMRMLAPDDAADVVQELPPEDRQQALDLLDAPTRIDVLALMAYKEDQAGGLMNSRYARLRPGITVDEAIRYLREQTRAQVETIYYAYVLDNTQKLLGAVSLRELFSAPSDKKVEEVMATGDRVVFIRENQDQEEIARIFANREHRALPVLDDEGRMKGIVTVDDVVQVVREEATEDIQKLGGSQVLDEPYLKISLPQMFKKRVTWLLVLFLGEMLTATAMGHYEHEISKAVVLALFIPLIISSGGNSGSQATTLVIRAMALGEVRMRDWWRVFYREIFVGLFLGLALGLVGIARIYFWPSSVTIYGEHYKLIALAVGSSLVGIVLWGSVVGSMLPLLLRRVGFDPAVASAPFVATLVDVTGIMLYFTMASLILGGTLL